MATKAFTLAALAALVRGHVIMQTPVPFDVANLNNSPLIATGSDFPCKAPNYGSVGQMNKFEVGGKGQLSFKGSAVHGGGSCQISVTYDNPPTPQSIWKVIHSIEGGCVTRTQAGNYPEDPNFPNPDTYDFTMPAIPDGEAILAMTWFNKIGNREMYMNCAPITISGQGSAENYNALPDMMKANIGNGCTTVDSTDTQFPAAGNSVERNDKGAFAPPVGNCGASAPSTPTTDTPGKGTPSPSATAPAKVTPSSPGGVFLPVDPSETPATPPPAPSTGGSAPPPPPPPPPAGGSGAQTGAQTGACSQNGAYNCIGGTSFQQCASGTWSPPMPLAAGTRCTPGVSTNFVIAAA